MPHLSENPKSGRILDNSENSLRYLDQSATCQGGPPPWHVISPLGPYPLIPFPHLRPQRKRGKRIESKGGLRIMKSALDPKNYVFKAPTGALHQNVRARGAKFWILLTFGSTHPILGSVREGIYPDVTAVPQIRSDNTSLPWRIHK